jgi:hypothetical protein
MASVTRKARVMLFGVGPAIVVLVLAVATVRAVEPLLDDRRATRAARHFIARGTLLVPATRSADLRGDARRDYWCFSDGTCFYPIERFRWFYPAYNDLEDTVLLKERARL